MFEAPIPGQSLTTEPRNNPWENPSEMSEVSDVVKYYIDKLADQEVLDDIAAVLDLGTSVKSIVVGLYRVGAMNGMHTVDAGILAAPTIHAFIKSAVAELGVDAKDDNVDLDKKLSDKEQDRFNALVFKYMESGVEEDEGTELLQELTESEPTEEMPEEEVTEIEAEEAPMGLMARGV